VIPFIFTVTPLGFRMTSALVTITSGFRVPSALVNITYIPTLANFSFMPKASKIK
jgi:hypothetical protein